MKKILPIMLLAILLVGCSAGGNTPVAYSEREAKNLLHPQEGKALKDQPNVYQTKEFHYIKKNPSDALAVNAFVKWHYGKFKGYYRATIMEGWLPDGKDLGLSQKAGSRLRGVLFGCNQSDVVLIYSWVGDMQLKMLEEKKLIIGDVIMKKESDAALNQAIDYLCGIGVA